MLTVLKELDSAKFKMSVRYQKDIIVEFADFFSYFKDRTDDKKVVFIDPVVLANQSGFFELENHDPNFLLVPTNLYESNKDLDSLKSILEVIEAQGIGRRGDIVCAVGGGALLDTVSFAASVFRRGISVLKVPTTLLGIVDAAIGIKTGINYLGQRNRIGTYHFDYKVVVDPNLMKGLNRKLIRQGLGEIFKIAVIKSSSLFDLLCDSKDHLENVDFYTTAEGLLILQISIQLMLDELHDNPKEDNLKRCVDFGHSFSPLVEMESLKRSGIRSLPHGYSVAYDCMLSSTISHYRGLLNEEDYFRILSLFLSFDFDFANDIYHDHNLLWSSFLEMTKHRGGNQNFPVPICVGSHSFLQDVSFEEMKLCADIFRKQIK
jgi:3-dehydroquinate synthetase